MTSNFINMSEGVQRPISIKEYLKYEKEMSKEYTVKPIQTKTMKKKIRGMSKDRQSDKDGGV